MDEKLAVMVSLYNSSQYITSKIKNLLRQTVIDQLDIILVNCQNLENEKALYEEYLQHPSVREIFVTKYCTLYHAWNLAIQSTNAFGIMNSNSDDMLRPDACGTILRELKDHDVVFGPYAITNKPNQYKWDGTSPPNLVQPVSWDRLFLGPCPAVRRSVFIETGLYDPDLYAIGDADMWGRWRQVGVKSKMLDKSQVLYYHNRASLERRNINGKSVIWLDSQTRKNKGAANWKPNCTKPQYPKLKIS